MRARILLLLGVLTLSLLGAPTSEAITFRSAPALNWGYTIAGDSDFSANDGRANARANQVEPKRTNVESKSKFIVTYINFPENAKAAFQYATNIWSDLYPSQVPITITAYWERTNDYSILGSARPGNFFNSFPGSPDNDLWYPSALANALAGKDLDPATPELIMRINRSAQWYYGIDGNPGSRTYDLVSVILHELCHGLGFLSNNDYDAFFNYGSIEKPTPFDAYAQLSDGRRLMDLPTPSIELGKALTSPLVWSGTTAIKANNGIKPKLYTPAKYQQGSSISHLDEATFSQTGLDSVMTPNLDSGEVFRTPGPIALAMLEDMRNKPPAGTASGIPTAPRNMRALVGDQSAIILFDPPSNARISQVTAYKITVVQTGEQKIVLNSPVIFTDLKNGSTYSFTVKAQNQLGESEASTSNSIIPEPGVKSTVIDGLSDGNFLATGKYQGRTIIAYSDSVKGDIKLATLVGKKWLITTVDGNSTSKGKTANNVAGDISLCVSGTGTKERLHLFYPDLVEKDLRYAQYDGKSWAFEVVDGDGPIVQNYEERDRVRTASDVSVTSACVVTPNSLQVFYRDESQGILLGALRTGKTWSYELVDGDRKTDGRSTGDTGFHLQAVAVGKKVYVLYDAILTMNQNKEATQGEMRLATRESIFPEDWSYENLDLTGGATAVPGYDIALGLGGSKGTTVYAAWFSSSGLSLPNPDRIKWVNLANTSEVVSATPGNYGTPSSPLAIDEKGILFGCQLRLCSMVRDSQTAHLAESQTINGKSQSAWIVIDKIRYALTSVGGKLSLLKV